MPNLNKTNPFHVITTYFLMFRPPILLHNGQRRFSTRGKTARAWS